MNDADTIIIGSGAGGLAAGVALARAGQKVLILEQHYVPGGWLHSFVRDGYKFSPGVHFLGHMQKGGNGRKMYEGLGVANDIVLFEQNKEGYDHNIIGNQHFRMPAGHDNLVAKLKDRFPKETRSIAQYMRLLMNIQQELLEVTKVSNWQDIITMPWRTRHIGRMGLWKFKSVLDFYLKDPYLKANLSLQCGNYGLPPQKTPFVVHAVVANHCMEGTMYPRGSGAALVKAFTKNIKKYGGEIRTSTPVKKILTNGTGRKLKAIGVELENGEKLYANQIVSNADPNKTYRDMLGEEKISSKLKKKLKNTSYTVAALNLFLIVDMDLRAAGLDSANIWYTKSPDLEKVYNEFMQTDLLKNPEFPGLFITSPTLKDPVSYDGKYHTIEVIAFANYESFKTFENTKFGERNPKYEALKEKLMDKIIRTMEKVVPGIRDAIIMRELGTPTTANHYVNITDGNCYGPEMTWSQLGPLRYPSKTEIENLYMCGSATLSHGILGAANSGVVAAAKILGTSMTALLENTEGQYLRTYSAEDDTDWPDSLKRKAEVRRKKGQVKAKLVGS